MRPTKRLTFSPDYASRPFRPTTIRCCSPTRSAPTSWPSSCAPPSQHDAKEHEMDALNLLKQDHHTVQKLFEQFLGAREASQQQQLCEQICTELKAHTALEEQCFYPEIRTVAELADMVDESLQE